MSNKVVEFMKTTLKKDLTDCLEGELHFNEKGCTLDARGGVYGIAIQLDEKERVDFFNKYNEKTTGKNKVELSDWKSIGDGFYPLYWEKDSNLGFRLFDHTKSRKSTETLQLDIRNYLKEHKIIYGAILCKCPSKSENLLRTTIPDIFVNHKGDFDFNNK